MKNITPSSPGKQKAHQTFRSTLLTALAAALLPVTLSALPESGKKTPPNWGERRDIPYETLQADFENPDMIYAPFAFWFWEAPLDVGQIATMAEEMTQQRMNPGYVHPRFGLPQEQWLSPLWFESIKAALAKAESSGAYLGYCDELMWPSGRANGKVLQNHPYLKAVSLRYEVLEIPGGQTVNIPDCFFATAARLEKKEGEHRIISSKSLEIICEEGSTKWTAPQGGTWCVYIFTTYFHPGSSGGNRSNVNYLDRRLMPAFMEIAATPYVENLGDKMGKSIPGVFVDHEGDYGYGLAWSDDLAKDYLAAKGADIRLRMPLMIDEDIEGLWPKARWDWFDVVTNLYNDGFFNVMNRWLEERGMYNVSNLWEEDLLAVALKVGSLIRSQRISTMPGNDALHTKALDVHDFKETQSVTEFESRRFQTEILGVAGWQMSPVLMKQSANAVIAWGASHIVPHGISLSRQLNKNRFPADWYTSNPYWPYLHDWNDFCRRASYINSQGHTVPDVLLLSPLDSVWSLLGGDGVFGKFGVQNGSERLSGQTIRATRNFPTIREIENIYSPTIQQLTENRIEYLIADDHYLNRMKAEQGALSHGPFSFKTVILPRMTILSYPMADKLLEAAKNGVTIYSLGPLPTDSIEKGKNDPVIQEKMAALRSNPNVTVTDKTVAALIAEKAKGLASQITFESGEFPMLQLHRRVGEQDFFWLVNNSGEKQSTSILVSNAKGSATIWDCETGEQRPLPSQDTANGSKLTLDFAPYEAFWLVFDPAKPASTAKPATSVYHSEIALNGPWTVKIDPAVQPAPPVQPAPASTLPQAITSKDGEIKPLSLWSTWGLNDFSGYVDYSTTVKVDKVNPDAQLDLGEVLHIAEVWVNGKNVGHRMWPPFTFKVGSELKKGENTIKVRVGNLLSNQMLQYGKTGVAGWKREIEERNMQSGLLGPVILEN